MGSATRLPRALPRSAAIAPARILDDGELARLLVAARIFAPGRRAEMEAAGRLPLDDHDLTTERPGARP